MASMSGRRTPRDFLVKPDQFGRREHALWVPVPDDRAEPFRMAAAFFQHRVAFRVREAIDLDPDMTVERFAVLVELTPATLKRKLYGAAPARLEEVLAWAEVAGVDVLPVIQERDQLYPRPPVA